MRKVNTGVVVLAVFTVLAILTVLAIVVFLNSPIQETRTDSPQAAAPDAANMILINLSKAMKVHSAINGGGGHSKFAKDLQQITHLSAEKIKAALPGPEQTSFEGYIVCLEENPKGDDFATNFLLKAYPANGYTGDVFIVDKTEKIIKVEKK